MTLQQLEYVLALDTYRHFVTAAEKCHVTQPTITIQLKKLEEEVGIQIFDRSTTPLTVTKNGSLFVSRTKAILAEVEQLKKMIHSERESIIGEFKIGVIPTVSPYLIPKFAKSFATKYPDTTLEIQEMQTADILTSLEHNELDIGILVTPLNEPLIREIPLYNEPFLFYGEAPIQIASKKKLEPKDVESLLGLWLLDSGHCFRSQVLNICSPSNAKQPIHFKSGSIETIKKMVDTYGGFTLIPELAQEAKDERKTLHFKKPKPIREVSLAVNKSFVKEKLLHNIQQEILSVIPKRFTQHKTYKKIRWR